MPGINIENIKPRQGLIVYVATSNIISKVVTAQLYFVSMADRKFRSNILEEEWHYSVQSLLLLSLLQRFD